MPVQQRLRLLVDPDPAGLKERGRLVCREEQPTQRLRQPPEKLRSRSGAGTAKDRRDGIPPLTLSAVHWPVVIRMVLPSRVMLLFW